MLAPVSRAGAVGRYAPSPTGRLHLGNLYAAIAAHDDIRQRHGTFILRIEDTDIPRNVAGAEECILDDLRWLGITWDEGPDIGGPATPYRQSERDRIYREALMQLARQGLIYPCRCSRKDLQSAASAPHGPDGLIYPGHCRIEMTPHAAAALVEELLEMSVQERDVSLRIRTDEMREIAFDDELHGAQRRNLAQETGDFVVLRRDGLWAYQFVCAVDDALMGITRVVRGSDLLGSTPRQVAIMLALGYDPPVYRHIPLLLDNEGNRMSKRDGSQSLMELQKQGLVADDVRQVVDNWLKK